MKDCILEGVLDISKIPENQKIFVRKLINRTEDSFKNFSTFSDSARNHRLDKALYDRILEKQRLGTITEGEFTFLRNFDLTYNLSQTEYKDKLAQIYIDRTTELLTTVNKQKELEVVHQKENKITDKFFNVPSVLEPPKFFSLTVESWFFLMLHNISFTCLENILDSDLACSCLLLIVLNSLINLLLTIQGKILIRKFNLEQRFPKLATFIGKRLLLQKLLIRLSLAWLVVSFILGYLGLYTTFFIF